MEFVQIGQFIAAFAFVVGLIGIFALVMRKLRKPQVRRRREGRLQVVETMMLDPKTRLYLIRRDDIEHLLIRSGDRFEVVETHIETEEVAAPAAETVKADVLPKAAQPAVTQKEEGFLSKALAQADEIAKDKLTYNGT